ncbi:sigma-E factor negative regulatory protein [Spongiibacter taiwanensis]|uniref:sigma-E factor negative regulatory protein n=1 Tax=Spongiibacter taiwanensis TaxID=1748242 RepID=UPI002035173B|nr:sigma-E factor negative regulatory protein [Spongiibacter taiwanensis]USA43670.1 sigma-E factor negative regulatory protein [Spongiibacter taiwanensis]
MNDTLKESLSALLDDEANDLELRRILAADDEAVREHWAELNRAQTVRHGGSVPFADLDISKRVMAEIADEPVARQGMSGWRQALSGVAVAASVAAVVVFGAMGTDMVGSGDTAVASAASPSAGRVFPAQAVQGGNGGVPVNAQLQPVTVPDAAADDEAKRRFETYLLRHADRAAQNSGQGVMSYSRVVGPESE